jgi:thiol-disulfide isomerase/thioredoxin
MVIAGTNSAFGQQYNITLNIKNLQDSVCYLAQYYGDKILLQDTAVVKNEQVTDEAYFRHMLNGEDSDEERIKQVVFEGDTALAQGLYVVAGASNNKIMDLVVGEQQQFSVAFDIKESLSEHITFKNSKENALFYDYVRYLNQQQKKMQQLQQAYQEATGDEKPELEQQIRKTNHEVELFQENFARENNNTFAGTFVKASGKPTVPDTIPQDNPRARYEYYKSHYWDNIPLDDDRMLRTPFFHDRWEQYLDKVIPQHPDSLIEALDFLLESAPDDGEIYKYVLWESTQKYEQSKIMGFDAVFTHLALNYFKEGRTSDINKQVVKNVTERGETLKNLLIGKKGPNLIMQDSTKTPRQLHDIKADYTVVVFWDSECGHCKKVVPKLAEFYKDNKDKYNLEVFSVSTDTSVRKWKQFINKHNLNWVNVFGYWSYTKDFHDLYDIYSTPVIYLLDKEKAIIGKRISIPQIEEIIQNKKKMN